MTSCVIFFPSSRPGGDNNAVGETATLTPDKLTEIASSGILILTTAIINFNAGVLLGRSVLVVRNDTYQTTMARQSDKIGKHEF